MYNKMIFDSASLKPRVELNDRRWFIQMFQTIMLKIPFGIAGECLKRAGSDGTNLYIYYQMHILIYRFHNISG
jgi:hypothetical protein